MYVCVVEQLGAVRGGLVFDRPTAVANGLVVSALGIRAWGPGFDSRVAPLFH